MKNNVISIFVDSVMWETVGTSRAKVSPTPFLDSLKEEAVTASKLYSHGPYTDAAKTSLFTGRNCLDDFGYYFRENSSPITDFKLFHDEGYETYCFSYPFWLYGEKMRESIDHMIYTASFIYTSEWGGMFKYYSELIKQRKLNDTEIKLLTQRFKLFTYSFLRYLEELSKNGEENMLLCHINKDFNFATAINTLKEEYSKFERDNAEYIKDFIEQGLEHVLANLDSTHIDSIVSKRFLDDCYISNKAFFKKIRQNNIWANVWRSLPSLKRILFGIRRYLSTKDYNNLLFLENYFLCLTPFDVMRKRWGRSHWQNDNSIHSILNAGLKLIRERDNHSERPFYMYLNTDDPHNNIAMFAYDIQEGDVINDEFRVLKEYADAIGTDFRGNLLYFLSLRYVDYEIETFCNRIKEMGLWDSTTLLVLSDHGSSYTFHPLHNSRVNCFDDECYHIPVLLRHPGFNGIDIDTYQNSKDILPTVCDLVGIEKPKTFTGHSMLDPNRPINNYVITEYMGPGCPDMLNRRMWLSIRDRNYIVGYKVGLFESFDNGEIAEVYDLKKDPNALYNINYKIKKKDIDYLLIPLRNRYEEIKNDTNNFISNLKLNKIEF